ncbi:MAG: DNA gyrase subunit A [Bacillati bacterium ANGP1]|uniref:DNA gyrase subunit A n=1 Tax=Candidatus Segetimicrobium genomatis TaxID=2569760 RepID=A0A537L1H0_9BACT|nr:MAG: DNA gyrase subunit A [Terrabacteria group bacterium ANGP1]
MADESRIVPKPIEEEMKTSYLDYAMSVIVSRALPDVRDGLKPVQRRILFGMLEAGLRPDRPYRKSAAVVGDVMKKYHPHGDVPIYESLVRMAQPWSFRYPLVDGQGNFGSIDGDPPAAMRYSECRLTPLAMELLADIDRDTVDFIPNYDEYEKEPVVLPAKVPDLLMNGASGIAVGMASNIPPHNLGELVDGLVAMIDDADTTDETLRKIIKGPDFPTGGIIIGRDGIKAAYTTGRGSITLRAKADIEELKGGRTAIIVTEIPYMVNKSAMIARIAELVRNKKLAGVSDLRDESDRSGMRIVMELRRDANPQIVRNQLFKHTQMQTTFGANMLALVGGVPRTLKLREMLDQYLKHRRTVVIRRTKFELSRAEERAHILQGLKVALKHLDDVIALIRKSKDVPVAREGLMKRFKLSERQADAILEMRLQRLTALEREKIEEEYKLLVKDIARYKEMLRDATSARPKLIMAAVRAELLEMKEKYGDARRTRITSREAEEFEAEDLIPNVDVVISMTHNNYIKRQPLETYRLQRRGTRGVIGVATKEEDFVAQVLTTTNHAFLLFFSDRGKVYRMKAHEVPEAGRTARGTAMVNLLALAQGERINAMIGLRSFEDAGSIVKHTGLMEFINAKRAGIFAITLDRADSLVGVKLISKETQIVLATQQGKAIRFKAGQVREMGRGARGVRGIRLRTGDAVVGVADAKEGRTLLTVTELGLGKRTPMGQYPIKSRGGMGVINVKITKKSGAVVSVRAVDDDDEILLGTTGGVFNRIPVAQISVMSRHAQGVRVMKLGEGEKVAAVAHIPAKE